MKNKEIDKKIISLWGKMARLHHMQHINFQNKELREKYGSMAQDVFHEIEKLINETGKSWDYYKSLPAIKEKAKACSESIKAVFILERQEREAECKGPRPNDTIKTNEIFDITGDIIITDPCYITKWIRPEHSRFTIYGDWSCSIWECNPDTMIPDKSAGPFGHFAADGAAVCVTRIDKSTNRAELEKFVDERPDLAVIIKNFTGKVYYDVHTSWYAYKGEWNKDESLVIKGIGTKDGKPFAFITGQTGF